MNIYLAGCGQLGLRLGEQLRAENAVIGLKRQAAELPFPLLTVDLGHQKAVERLPLDASIIIFTATPSHYDEAGYRHVYETLLGNIVDWAGRHEIPPLVLLVSSTGVYGQQGGQWVDESSDTQPTRASGKWIVFGEQLLKQRLDNTLTVRFSGIYGNNRTRLIQQVRRGEAIQKTPPIWTNRIHEDDCVGVLKCVIERYQQAEPLDRLYLASDDCPVSQYDVYAFICQQLGRPAPAIKSDNLSAQCNKRCDNRRLKALGYQFQYADYRSGYRAIIASVANLSA